MGRKAKTALIVENEENLECFEDQRNEMGATAADNFFMQGKLIQMNKSTRRKRNAKTVEGEDDPMDEEVSFPPCDLSALRDYANSAKKFSDIRKIEKMFPTWRQILANGNNILIHGVGSKRSVLDKFSKEYEGYNKLVIDGLDEEGSARELLKVIEKCLKLKTTTSNQKSPCAWARSIVEQLQQAGKQLFIFFHNIDGPNYRALLDQEILATLADGNNVRFTATVDHINATLMWDTKQMTMFKWIHMEANTYDIPIEEMVSGNSKVLGLHHGNRQFTHTVSSLDVFWMSLNRNSREIFRTFFCLVLANKKPVPFYDLAECLRNSFSASSDTALRQQLVEFMDHQLLKIKRKDDGNELLESALDTVLIENFFMQKNLKLEV